MSQSNVIQSDNYQNYDNLISIKNFMIKYILYNKFQSNKIEGTYTLFLRQIIVNFVCI